MISYLKGKLSSKMPTAITIDCGGVGYEVNVPLSTFDKLPQIDEQLQIFIYYSFNQNDGVRLYGFLLLEEKQLFQQLISISKIGPKIALGILSGISVNDLIRAIQIADVVLISTVPGIGKKTAERLVIELKDKVGNIKIGSDFMTSNAVERSILNETETALVTLGYKRFEIKKAIAEISQNNQFTSSEEAIKMVMKSLYKKRK
ncbi:MAG: Holliday junction branch migration protein RuvA [Candidatus Cloacimonetes bacterium]|jgi:holliday junction DNA helicase RuvA|nr:Holliday junction branch migration protein RuvA [Candidatus Cloacimonadota bacterium]MBT6994284.1 Holliday junction branch migration protein RuvA [Candidatus Cloacimonadota bacterium]MBT7469132.1 Holliday junction branch migration protein RuvA [Candidatus Cloacimonadota bacterium]